VGEVRQVDAVAVVVVGGLGAFVVETVVERSCELAFVAQDEEVILDVEELP